LYAISSIETLGMNWLWWAILLGSFCLLTLFVIRQRQLAQPFLDLSVLRYRGYIPGLLLTGISYSGLIIATVIMPLFYQRVFNITPMWSGLLMVPAAVFLSQLNPRTGRLLNQIGLKKLVYIGMAMMMVGYAGLALFGTQSWVVGLLAALLLEGGNAFVMMPAVTAANNVLPESLVSHGTALITTMRQVIGAASVVVATLLISHFNTTVTIGQALSRTSAWFILVPVAGVLLATQLKRHEGD